MARRLAGFIIDCRDAELSQAARFWSQALGLPVQDADENGRGRYAVLAPGPAGLHIEVQRVEHESRLHLDIEADDIDAEATNLEALGATRINKPHGRWWVMQAPTGHRFCIIAWRERGAPATRVDSESKAGHHSGLICLVIDCQVEALNAATDFWSAALQRSVASRDQDGDGNYAELKTEGNEPYVLLQRVGHAPRVHLDLAADDQDAEAARLEALGAQRIAFTKRWWVMQAPTGHRFCIVRPQRDKSALPLNAWG